MNEIRAEHPTPDQLVAFDQGQLAEGEWDWVESHVADCASCCQQLESVLDDPLVAFLRDVSESSSGLGPATGHFPPPAKENPALPSGLDGHPRYRVLGPLGSGGMGTIYRAEHRFMERLVALKVIRRELTDRPEAIERFRLEVKAAAHLSHPNIVTVHDADQADDSQFLVMELVEGEPLNRVVEKRNPVPAAHACDWARQAALGLEHARERGMVHRDIKPSNLLLTPEGQVKILDFGLARFLSESGPEQMVTPSGVVVGTPEYISPEQAFDSRRADIRADIYSLGCTLYHLLAGRPPFPDGTFIQKILAHREQQPPPLRELRPDLPEGLARIVERMMAKEPSQRYQTPAEVADALEPFSEPAGPLSVPTFPLRRDGADTVPLLLPRRRTLFLVFGGLSTVAALSALILGYAAFSERIGHMIPLPGRHTVDPDGGPVGPAEQPALPGTVIRRFEGHPGIAISVAFAPNGRMAASGGNDPVIFIWDVDSGRKLHTLQGHAGNVRSVAFSPDGTRLLSGSGDETLRLWDVAEERPLRVMDQLNTHFVQAVNCSHDGKRAISGGYDHAVRIWNLNVDRAPEELKDHRGPVRAVAFCPGDRLAVSASDDRRVLLWDLDEMRVKHQFDHAGPVSSVVVSHYGRFAVSGSHDRTVRIWDLATGKPHKVIHGHEKAVLSVALTKDGKYIVSGGADHTARIWDAETGAPLHILPHPAPVHGVAVAPDGQTALTACEDGSIRLWQMPRPAEGVK